MRVKVQIPLRSPLIQGLCLEVDEKTNIWIPFKYERLPSFCYYCDHLDHEDPICPSKNKDCKARIKKPYSYGVWLNAGTPLCQFDVQFPEFVLEEQSSQKSLEMALLALRVIPEPVQEDRQGSKAVTGGSECHVPISEVMMIEDSITAQIYHQSNPYTLPPLSQSQFLVDVAIRSTQEISPSEATHLGIHNIYLSPQHSTILEPKTHMVKCIHLHEPAPTHEGLTSQDPFNLNPTIRRLSIQPTKAKPTLPKLRASTRITTS
ncbi:hypothetical protein Scep_019842 [Stephania cephalantha]|uniref:Zinc knuckle CX2CX4HX4C domain-containing protein n=1 Tax=Stephania cephalantha TaxID=152367 RepID=A0AAP0IBY1_9MAGN